MVIADSNTLIADSNTVVADRNTVVANNNTVVVNLGRNDTDTMVTSSVRERNSFEREKEFDFNRNRLLESRALHGDTHEETVQCLLKLHEFKPFPKTSNDWEIFLNGVNGKEGFNEFIQNSDAIWERSNEVQIHTDRRYFNDSLLKDDLRKLYQFAATMIFQPGNDEKVCEQRKHAHRLFRLIPLMMLHVAGERKQKRKRVVGDGSFTKILMENLKWEETRAAEVCAYEENKSQSEDHAQEKRELKAAAIMKSTRRVGKANDKINQGPSASRNDETVSKLRKLFPTSDGIKEVTLAALKEKAQAINQTQQLPFGAALDSIKHGAKGSSSDQRGLCHEVLQYLCPSADSPSLPAFSLMMEAIMRNDPIFGPQASSISTPGNLCPIPKKVPTDVRPIVIADTLDRRAEAILNKMNEEGFRAYLNQRIKVEGSETGEEEVRNAQHSFASPGGASRVIKSIELLCTNNQCKGVNKVVAQFDCKNAFNAVEIEYIAETLLELPGDLQFLIPYFLSICQEPGILNLFMPEGRVEKFRQECGVRQGGPLSGLLFNLAFSRCLRKLFSEAQQKILPVPSVYSICYADDMYMVGAWDEVIAAAGFLQNEALKEAGLEFKEVTVLPLNKPGYDDLYACIDDENSENIIDRTGIREIIKILPPMESLDETSEDRTIAGISVVGIPFGSSQFIEKFIFERLAKIKIKLDNIAKFANREVSKDRVNRRATAVLMFDWCGKTQIDYMLQNISPELFKKVYTQVQEMIDETFQSITGITFDSLGKKIIHLPTCEGGQGVTDIALTNIIAYNATWLEHAKAIGNYYPSIDIEKGNDEKLGFFRRLGLDISALQEEVKKRTESNEEFGASCSFMPSNAHGYFLSGISKGRKKIFDVFSKHDADAIHSDVKREHGENNALTRNLAHIRLTGVLWRNSAYILSSHGMKHCTSSTMTNMIRFATGQKFPELETAIFRERKCVGVKCNHVVNCPYGYHLLMGDSRSIPVYTQPYRDQTSNHTTMVNVIRKMAVESGFKFFHEHGSEMNSFPNTIIKHSDGTSKTLAPDFIITSRELERNMMGDHTQTASFCFDDCTSNSDNALKAQSKAKLLKYKELAER